VQFDGVIPPRGQKHSSVVLIIWRGEKREPCLQRRLSDRGVGAGKPTWIERDASPDVDLRLPRSTIRWKAGQALR